MKFYEDDPLCALVWKDLCVCVQQYGNSAYLHYISFPMQIFFVIQKKKRNMI